MNVAAITIEHGVPIPPLRTHHPNECVFCNARPRVDPYKTCDQCRQWAHDNQEAQRAAGLCLMSACPNPPATDRTLCDTHLERLRSYARGRRRKQKKQQICISCNKRPQWWTLLCVICRTENPQYQDILPAGARKALRRYRRLERRKDRRLQAAYALGVLRNYNPRLIDRRAIEILAMRHGLIDGQDRTLEEIGARFSITRERVRQIEAKTLRRLAVKDVDITVLTPPFGGLVRAPAGNRHHLTTETQRKHALAHRLVTEALKEGTLTKKPCEKCGNPKAVGHHPDYDKPLEVQWLCRKHHMEAHLGFWLDYIKGESAFLEIFRRYRLDARNRPQHKGHAEMGRR